MKALKFFFFIAGTMFYGVLAFGLSPNSTAESLVSRFNTDFYTHIYIEYDKTTPWGLSCVPHQEPKPGDPSTGVIHLCDSFLDALYVTYGISESERVLSLILAHELSHFLLDMRGDDPVEKDAQHENIDGLAAKIYKSYDLSFPQNPNSFDISLILPASELLTLTAQMNESMEYFRSVQKLRIKRIRKSYDEGWESWSTYRQLYSPCTDFDSNDDKIFKFLKAKMTNLNNIGSKACQNFSEAVFLFTKKSFVSDVKANDE